MEKTAKTARKAKTSTDRRNSRPNEVQVLHWEDLDMKESLASHAEQIQENRFEVFIHNVEYLCAKERLPQAKLCAEKLEGRISPPQLTGYKQRGKQIPFSAMVLIASAFNLEVEDMCSQILDEAEDTGIAGAAALGRPMAEYEKYLGTFDLAYFDTSAPLGKNAGTAEDELARAVLTVYTTRNAIGITRFHVAAIFNCTVDERMKIVNYTSGIDFSKDARETWNCYNKVVNDGLNNSAPKYREKCLYHGEIHLTENMAEIDLHQIYGSDVVHLVAHNRAANSSAGKDYRGGLATMLSISRGVEHMPCMQAVILMRGTSARFGQDGRRERRAIPCKLDYFPPEVLAERLYMAPPKIELGSEIKKIVSYMKFLFDQRDKSSVLSDLSFDEKTFCLESFAEKNLTEALRRNILSYYKLAVQMDSEVYSMIRETQD